MAIGVFMYPEQMTAEQYGEILRRLETEGQASPAGRQHHFAFGNEESLMVVDIWDSEEDFATFADVLDAILTDLGIETEPGLLQLHNHI